VSSNLYFGDNERRDSQMCCNERVRLVCAQKDRILQLTSELHAHIVEGNEYYAELTRDDLIVAVSSARLLHKHTTE
jgi:hypothetical protein